MPALEPATLAIPGAEEIPADAVAVAGAMAAAEGGLSLAWPPAPPLVLSTEVMNVPPPPGRASLPSLVAAPPAPPPLEQPVVAPVVPLPVPAAVAAPPDDTEDVIVYEASQSSQQKFSEEEVRAMKWKCQLQKASPGLCMACRLSCPKEAWSKH